MIDGGLRKLFQKHLPLVHWVPIETWSTGQGVPDTNFCHVGVEGWIEFKATPAWSLSFQPGQIAWHERRFRAGGRSFIAVRRHNNGGPRRGAPVDELWLYRGISARILASEGLRRQKFGEMPSVTPPPLICSSGGPTRWPWPMILAELIR